MGLGIIEKGPEPSERKGEFSDRRTKLIKKRITGNPKRILVIEKRDEYVLRNENQKDRQ